MRRGIRAGYPLGDLAGDRLDYFHGAESLPRNRASERLFRSFDGDRATPSRNNRESRQNGDFCVSWSPWIIKIAGEPVLRAHFQIDRIIRAVTSRPNASPYACHHRLANSYRSQLLRCRRTTGARSGDSPGRYTGRRCQRVLGVRSLSVTRETRSPRDEARLQASVQVHSIGA